MRFITKHKTQKLLILFWLLVFALLWLAIQSRPVEAATTIYVNKNASGSNNGTTWKNAYVDLQTALLAAQSGDEVWVAAGIYSPGTTQFDSFSLPDGVAVYGGFNASETVRNQRDWETNLTILSGDISGDDITNSDGIVLDHDDIVGTNNGVVIETTSTSSSTILDGFTITAGNNTSFAGRAGGMVLDGSSATLRNIHFVGNKGGSGGALHLRNSSTPQISEVTIENNKASSRGGGIYIEGASHAVIENSKILGNSADSQGGGIYSVSSDLTLENLFIQGNTALIDGGGAFLSTSQNSVLNNLVVTGNNTVNSSSEGGGLHLFDFDTSLRNLTIVGNSASIGGGVANSFGSVNIHNSIIWGNVATNSGSTASSWENFNASTWVTFSNVADLNTFQNGGNNLDSDPLFQISIDAVNAPTTAGDFQLQGGSPSIDVGNSALYTSSTNVDILGNTRINGSAIDMGAFESNFVALDLTVDGSGSGSVTSSPSGINCPGDCLEQFNPNTVVTLTASPSTGSGFAGWTGASGCANTVTCIVTMDAAKTITATFNLSPYILTTLVSPSNGGTLESSPSGINCPGDCSETYLFGTSVVLTPTAASGYEFTGWGGAGGCTGLLPCTVLVDTSKLVSANFSPVYTLTVSKSGGGSGTVDSNPSGVNCGSTCSMSAVDGTVIELNATPTAGSIFTGWSGGGCSGTGNCFVTLNATTTVTANFEPIYELTVNKSGNGSGTVTGNPFVINCGGACVATLQAGTTITLSASADSGSIFLGWSGGGCSGTGSCVVTLNAAETITADFAPQYVLTVTKSGAGDGTITSSPNGIDCGLTCSTAVTEGDSVTLTAAADGDSEFIGWTGGGCSGLGSCTVQMNQAETVQAMFEPVYQLDVNMGGDGTGTVSDSTNTIDCTPVCSMTALSGTLITLTASADTGSVFVGWSGDDCSNNAVTCIVTLDAVKAVTATFAQEFDLIVGKDGTGVGRVSSIPALIDCGITCTNTAASGTVITLTASAESGSIFDGWTGSGCSGNGTCVVTLSASQTVTATFTDIPNAQDLTVVNAGDGGGVVTSDPAGILCGAVCAMSVIEGTVITLTASADTGSEFAGWTGDCVGTGSCVVTLNANQAVTATFTTIPVTHTLSVTLSGDGSGTVTSNPAGIMCGTICSMSALEGSLVSLTAVASQGSEFVGWSGAGCSGTAPCTLTIDDAKTVNAIFESSGVEAPNMIFLPVVIAP